MSTIGWVSVVTEVHPNSHGGYFRLGLHSSPRGGGFLPANEAILGLAAPRRFRTAIIFFWCSWTKLRDGNATTWQPNRFLIVVVPTCKILAELILNEVGPGFPQSRSRIGILGDGRGKLMNLAPNPWYRIEGRQWGESAFEEVELLDAVDYGGPQRSSCGPVSRRVRLGWRSLVGIELGYGFRGSWGLFPQSIPR